MVRPYAISLGVGALVCISYHLLRVRSPAPPLVALVGLLGMLAGEEIIPVIQSAFTRPESHVDRPATASPNPPTSGY